MLIRLGVPVEPLLSTTSAVPLSTNSGKPTTGTFSPLISLGEINTAHLPASASVRASSAPTTSLAGITLTGIWVMYLEVPRKWRPVRCSFF